MKLNKALLALIISAVFLTACSDDEADKTLTDGTESTKAGVGDASTNALGSGNGINGSAMGGANGHGANGMGADGMSGDLNDPSSPLAKRTIYFTLDSSEVQQEFVPVIASHAQYLVAHPSQHLVLQGHTDERGSREYNIALGEQRAKSVASMMKVQGVTESQLDIVSYGEEKPAASGSDESAWEQNRRVELDYQGQ